MSHNHNFNEGSEGHFYKGLFFGLVLGVGLVYFLKTKEGQRLKQELLSSGEELLDDLSEKVIEFLEDKPVA